jgi:hypothetical protein
MSEYEDYLRVKDSNTNGFQQNYRADLQDFELLTSKLNSIWERVGATRDAGGQSHVGLLQFINILRRHSMLGFESIVSYQSFLTWSNFRSGLEALLIVGKFVDDPGNAKVWLNRASNLPSDKKAYSVVFSGQSLKSTSLSRSVELRDVLTHLNDNYMHPNPDFAFRDSTRVENGSDVLLRIELFDVDQPIHEAHLLAYLNLLAVIVEESYKLVVQILGSGDPQEGRNLYEGVNSLRAGQIAASVPGAKKILKEYGLWQI